MSNDGDISQTLNAFFLHTVSNLSIPECKNYGPLSSKIDEKLLAVKVDC